MLRVGGEEAQPCELIYGSVLKQAKLRICDATARNDLYVHLNALSGMVHLLIRLWFVSIFGLFVRKHPQPSHYAKQALRVARIAALPQTMPKLDHAQRWVSAAHVTNELQLGFRVLVRMAVRASGLAGEERLTSIPALLPKVDVRPTFVVLSAGAADAVLFCVFHQRLPIRHVLCYTLAHEG